MSSNAAMGRFQFAHVFTYSHTFTAVYGGDYSQSAQALRRQSVGLLKSNAALPIQKGAPSIAVPRVQDTPRHSPSTALTLRTAQAAARAGWKTTLLA